MGILNVTPDSFAETAPCLEVGEAIDRALQMQAEGADLIDVGGESTRPGAEPVSADEETRRVLPVLEALAGRIAVPLSIDTSKAAVADAALGAGAVVVNDVSGLRYDRALGRVAARRGAALVLMHSRGRSRTMYREAAYDDVVREIADELRESIERAAEAGVPVERIVLDPGLGFAKRAEHSYRALASLADFAALDRPLLVGPSRKSFLTAAAGTAAPVDRDWMTAGAVAASVLAGAHIVRVHNVAAMRDVVRVVDRVLADATSRGSSGAPAEA